MKLPKLIYSTNDPFDLVKFDDISQQYAIELTLDYEHRTIDLDLRHPSERGRPMRYYMGLVEGILVPSDINAFELCMELEDHESALSYTIRNQFNKGYTIDRSGSFGNKKLKPMNPSHFADTRDIETELNEINSVKIYTAEEWYEFDVPDKLIDAKDIERALTGTELKRLIHDEANGIMLQGVYVNDFSGYLRRYNEDICPD